MGHLYANLDMLMFMGIKFLYIIFHHSSDILYNRCDIPVVIMGETGCGKTRLIRYMCDLARQGQDGKNMLILKV